MGIEFDKMKPDSKMLYETMWGEGFDSGFFDDNKIDKTYNLTYKKKSNDSYSFIGEGCKAKILSDIFGIEKENMDLFCSKYDMATSGDGNEGNKILTLHSSSLCALLHFYNVTEKNPLTLNLQTKKNKIRKVKFIKSVFEYKSPVINGSSNMDVVLIGNDIDSEERIVFFLESKFSEYYTTMSKKKDDISVEYLKHKYSSKLYDDNVLRKMDLYVDKKGEKSFCLKTNKESFYIDGIKQMISHYTGIRNVLAKKDYNGWDTDERQKAVDEELEKGAVAILGEIIFDDRIGKLKNCQKIYSEKYAILAEQMSKQIDKDMKFEILTKQLGYSEFKTNEHYIEDKIRKFYREDV